jgi:genome maintenance exonuclease 1
MTFNHVKKVELKPLERVEVHGVRHYLSEGTDLQQAVPSVTTVLSSLNTKWLEQWKSRVGHKEAERVSHHASTQGTLVHEAIEAHCGNQPLPSMMPLVQLMFKSLQRIADTHINNIHMIEGQMLSRYLRVAGTVDMIAEWDGILSVIDWKTSGKPKKEEWVHDYFKQEAAYAVMYEENGGPPVSQLVTAITCSDGSSQVFIQKRDDWIGGFIEARDAFEQHIMTTTLNTEAGIAL